MTHSMHGAVLKTSFRLSALTVSCLLAFNAQAAMDCSSIDIWNSSTAYSGGAQVQESNKVFEAKWWTQGNNPTTHSGPSQEWRFIDNCATTGNTPPTVSLTSPAGGPLTAGDQVTIAADASDSDGTIAQVEFYLGQTLLATVSNAPYTAAWTATAGSHTITAKAIDDLGAVSESTLAVTVQQPDTGNTAPTADVALSAATVEVGAAVTLTAQAADSDGSIEKVDFLVGGTLVGTVASAPYTFSYTANQPGTFAVVARATDNQGATTDSAAAQLTITGTMANTCRPDGLYQTEGVNVPYCTIYDTEGREIMGADHPRRVIGYFTSWRAGNDPQTSYLVNDIPWEQLTHINYAFVSIGSDGKVNIGDVNDPANPAVGLEWNGVEIDPALGFKGHFGALATAKAKHDVKTLISIGGWAETGGHFGHDGQRVADGGFYTMTTNADGSINHAGIETFADSAVAMMRQYKFDGLDIDYEYPTSMSGAGNPDDKAFAEPRRPHLMKSYHELMRVLREKLDRASAEDGIHYMLTIAAPSSGYLLRGMETMAVTQYLDYVNIMS